VLDGVYAAGGDGLSSSLKFFIRKSYLCWFDPAPPGEAEFAVAIGALASGLDVHDGGGTPKPADSHSTTALTNAVSS